MATHTIDLNDYRFKCVFLTRFMHPRQVRQNQPTCVEALLEGGADPSTPGPRGVTPLMYAAALKNAEMVEVASSTI
jgi:hypothetical protein